MRSGSGALSTRGTNLRQYRTLWCSGLGAGLVGMAGKFESQEERFFLLFFLPVRKVFMR